uniref:Reverse transcriptase domain-containing protein n=1 Tax=Nelumbo nucifera TaxID=4432 RepID=A0A822YKW4_NELNU|nr:TPA_asm: hypothetical protein HUJ06_010780 [Nelumbo nucifera]
MLGHQIHDNRIIASEVVHTLSHMQGKHGGFILKLDLAKANDKIKWSFLEWCLKRRGFSPHLCKLIMCCIASSSFSILLNGEKSERFTPERGLH